jgi:hypothetical protein
MDATIRHSAHPVTEEQLTAIENRLKISLPSNYRAFLLRHNGGVPRPEWLNMQPEGAYVRWFLPIGRAGMFDPRRYDFESAFARLKYPGSPLAEHLVPVAEGWAFSNPGVTPDFYCLSVRGADQGTVYYWRDIPDPNAHLKPPPAYTIFKQIEKAMGLPEFKYRFKEPRFAAASLEDLLDRLEHHEGEEPPDWLLLIEDNNVDAFREWLSAGKGRHKARTRWSTVLEHAVDEDRWEIVELLLERGESATEAFESALGTKRYGIARRLLGKRIKPGVVRKVLVDLSPYLWHDLDFVAAALATGADPNYEEPEWDGRNRPLHYAAKAGNVDAVRLLLQHGANPDVVNSAGQRPYEAALASGHEAVADVLKGAARKGDATSP